MPIRNTVRNTVARAAILRKGGVHEKCRTSKRQRQKRQLDDAVDDYLLSRYSHSKQEGGNSSDKVGSIGNINEQKERSEVNKGRLKGRPFLWRITKWHMYIYYLS